MPNEKVLREKQAIVQALADKMKNAAGGVLVDYKGITVAEDTALRVEMRKNGVDYAIVKNTLTAFAAKEIGFDALLPILNGTTALAVSMDDPVAAAKVVQKFSDKMAGKKYFVKAGFVEGRVVSTGDVKALADLPSKDALRAQVLGTMIAPVSGLANVLNANIRGLAVALQAIADQKSA